MLRALLGKSNKAPLTAGATRRLASFQPLAENLESRQLLATAQGTLLASAIAAGLDAVPGEVIVQFRDRATPAARNAIQARFGANSSTPLDASSRTVLWQLPAGTNTTRLLNALNASRTILVAQPNAILHATEASNDPLVLNGSTWGNYGDDPSVSPGTSPNAFGSQAEEAWAVGYTGSSQVYIGIVDEGVMIQHPDLAPNIWTNPFDPLDGIDNDRNGYIDDTNGWDFFSNDRNVYDGTFDDHGTHVAGTIGAVGGNGVGTAGVAWNVTMIPAKFLGPNGGSLAGAIRALDYLTDLKLRHGLRIVATNNSWSGGSFSPALQAAITRGAKADILFVAAAGNNGANLDRTPRYPAAYTTVASAGYEAVISVAAITSTGARASYSNYGAKTVDIAAPGTGILSTLPGPNSSSTYGSYSGTSMAAPHVTGAIALYAAAYPTATAAQIRQALLDSAAPTPSVNGLVATNGRLDIGQFLANAPASGSTNTGQRLAALPARPATSPSVGMAALVVAAPRLIAPSSADSLTPTRSETPHRIREWRRAIR